MNFLHELGHHVHLAHAGDNNVRDAVERRVNEGWRELQYAFSGDEARDEVLRGDKDTPTVSRYATSSREEYFAECFATYIGRGPSLLKAKDAEGYQMVKDVLKIRGIE